MNMDHMFKYREILVAKSELARQCGNQRQLNALLKSITAIDVMLESALMATVDKCMPEIKFNLDMFDSTSLQFLMPNVNIALLPKDTQVTLKFDSEDETLPNGDEKASTVSIIEGLLKSNFTSNIETAVNLYIEKIDASASLAEAWLSIVALFPEREVFKVWHNYLTSIFRTQGPIVAFASAKKHLKQWDDLEVAKFIGKLIEDRIATEPYSIANELQNAMNPTQAQIYGYIEDKKISSLIDKMNLENIKSKQEFVHRVVAYCNPSKREQIEKRRKNYVEKGY